MNRILPILGLATAGLLTLSACGSSGSATSATSQSGGTTGRSTQQGADAGFGPGGQGFPGAVGKIAAKTGKTLQVQGNDGQTAVTYTAKTDITAQVAGTVNDLKVGSCVMVIPASGTGSGSGSGSGQPVTAGTVRVTPKNNGSCDGGFGGRGFGGRGPGRGGPSERPSGLPSDFPSDFPSGRPSGFPGRAFGTSGEVTAVTSSGFTVAARTFGSAGASPGTASVSVKVTGATTVLATQVATPTSLKVGACVTATGKTDDTGAVTAARISVSDPVDGQCTGGFTRRGGSQDGSQ